MRRRPGSARDLNPAGEGMDQGGSEREAAAGWGRRGRRRGAVIVDLDWGEGLGWVADLEGKNGGGGGRNERKNGGGGGGGVGGKCP